MGRAVLFSLLYSTCSYGNIENKEMIVAVVNLIVKVKGELNLNEGINVWVPFMFKLVKDID